MPWMTNRCSRSLAQRYPHRNGSNTTSGLFQVLRPVGRPLQRKIPSASPVGDHPVQYILAVRPEIAARPGQPNPDIWNKVHVAPRMTAEENRLLRSNDGF
jgi:hypothetical protein